MISIIIRTKNEERWIGSCLEAIGRQTRDDVEIILVDNLSTDKTIEKACQNGVKLVTIEDFFPGAAINRGIEASTGEIIVCISGHCIPVDEYWLENLVSELDDESVGGVYGRQEPLAFTPDLDKRDLLITFGLDRREQVKDSFFHNANSAFRRSLWEQFPFDERVTNIEDRIWAHAIQQAGYKIVYEPSASVYHYHGIHQNQDRARCGNIIKIIDNMNQKEIRSSGNQIDPGTLNVVIILPVREEGLRLLGGRPLYEYSLDHARSSSYVRSIVVSTELDTVASNSLACGADMALIRSSDQSRFDVILEQLLQTSLRELEEREIYPDILVMLESTYPFREPAIIDRLIEKFCSGGFDTVIPAREEFNSCWMEEDGSFRRVDESYIARKFKTPYYAGIKGLCCVCSPAVVRQGQIFGDNVGLYKLRDLIPTIEVRTDTDARFAESLMASGNAEIMAQVKSANSK